MVQKLKVSILGEGWSHMIHKIFVYMFYEMKAFECDVGFL